MKLPSKLVGIVGRSFQAVIKDCNAGAVTVNSDKHLTLTDVQTSGSDLLLTFTACETGRGIAMVTLDGSTYRLPYAIFNEKEFFVCLIISSNYHIGFDPEHHLINSPADQTLYEGHGFNKAVRMLADPIYHSRDLPITWLIDEKVAKDKHDSIDEWHYRYYDDYGIMPSSFIHFNAINMNIVNTQAEVTGLLDSTRCQTEAYFDYYTETAGIDQFIGSVDNKFTNACREIGLKGLWGIGYDHFECDTSMYHRGAPWDCYKPSSDNCRIPSVVPSDLWAFQWTQRDVLNTVMTPTGESGSVMFSFDADDVRATNIVYHQKDYYNKLLKNYRSNLNDNEFGVFVIHQEDHDTGYVDSNAYYDTFLAQIDEDVTFATMNEICQWLNLKYSAAQNASQSVIATDCLDCKDDVKWGYGGVSKPADWGKYPDFICYYDTDIQLIARYGDRFPLRVYDYRGNRQPAENQILNAKELPQVELLSEEIADGVYRAQVKASGPCEHFPVILYGDKASRTITNGIVKEKYTIAYIDI